jgi:hypothetical protein
MFQLRDTVWLEGERKTIIGDETKTSGIRSTNGNQMNGPYGAMLVLQNALECVVMGLELDANGNPTELIFVNSGIGCRIEGCYLHDIRGNQSGQPFAAIHSQVVVGLKVHNNRVERTDPNGEGVRGIWVPSRADTSIIGNSLADIGHTGIAFEGDGCEIRGNIIRNIKAHGAGMKIHYRVVRQSKEPRATRPLLVTENVVDGSVNSGIMLESCAVDGIDIVKNEFKNCGKQGTSFGAIYSSSNATNVVFRENKLDNCRSIAGLIYMNGCRFENNQVVNGPPHVNLEKNCTDVRLTNSGAANVGPGCSNIWVDGRQVA